MEISPVMSLEELLQLRGKAAEIAVSDKVKAYILSLVSATRNMPQVKLGVSPRGSIALFRCAQAMALMNDRDYATPDDVKSVAGAVLSHRLILAAGQTDYSAALDVIDGLLGSVPVPM